LLFNCRCQEEVHPKARFARSTQKVVLSFDEHAGFDGVGSQVTTDLSVESMMYDDIEKVGGRQVHNEFVASLNEPDSLEEEDEGLD
jgi:hypothetical protein